MKKLFLLGICLWVLAAPLRAVAGPPAIIVVRIHDYGRTATAVITRGEGKSEVIEIKPKGNFETQLTQSSEAYYVLFQRLYQEGYVLQSTVSTPEDRGGAYSTLLFTKAQ